MAEESRVAVDETETFERDTELNIWLRVNAVMAEVGGHVEKDGQHATSYKQKDGSKKDGKPFAYVSHDLVTAHIRAACVKHGIAVLPSVVEYANNGNRAELTVQTDFVNIDKPEDRIAVRSIGYGADYSDKGPGKAFSYAIKSAYLKLFMLNSADDIEDTDVHHESDGSTQKMAAAQAKINELDKTALNNLSGALKGAQSIEAIDDLMKINKKLLTGVPDVTREHFGKLADDLKREMEQGG